MAETMDSFGQVLTGTLEDKFVAGTDWTGKCQILYMRLTNNDTQERVFRVEWRRAGVNTPLLPELFTIQAARFHAETMHLSLNSGDSIQASSDAAASKAHITLAGYKDIES